MSTRCNIHFTSNPDGTPEANIYRHIDGYPDGVLPDLQEFFADVEAQTTDTRFDDPSYLAAKFVVWQAFRYATGKPLDFLSVGVMTRDAGDSEYIYTVTCISSRRPKVTYREAGELGEIVKIYSNHITRAEVRRAFVLARTLNGADIWIENDDIRTWTPPKRLGYAHGIEVFGESIGGKRFSQHGRRAASWQDWGYVIAYLFNMDADARIGIYDSKEDFVARTSRYRPPGSSPAFLDVLDKSGYKQNSPDPIVFGPSY